jgi:alpha-tubulin suppressor-like RCC1 family protein
MSSIRVTTNFKDNFGTDLGTKLITKDYLMSVYPGIAQEIGKTPELWVWGANTSVELGINATGSRSTPVTTFAGGTNWKQVSTRNAHTAAIKTDGTLWVWGSNSSSQLGINATGNISTPVTTFAGGTNWKEVSCGYFHTAAIKTDGTLWVWGNNNNSQLGINATAGNRSTPVTTFAGGTNWKQISGGRLHSAAIKTDGTLWVWGRNSFGALGTNDIIMKSTPVTTFAGGTNWKQVSSGGPADTTGHTAAIKTDGTLWTWGGNGNGQLGTNDANGRSTPITTLVGGNNWKQVSIADSYTTSIKNDGTLWVWGYNFNGQLGINQTTDRSTPVTTFSGGTNWKQVNAVNIHASAIKTDGTLWLWGSGGSGRLGVNDTTQRNTPVTTIAGGNNWKQVNIGFSYTTAIESADFI